MDARYSVPKINSACGFAGGGKDGMEELMTQVSKLTGFMPDGYALVDLDAFVKIVDLMGGVDFNVPMDMRYSDPPRILTSIFLPENSIWTVRKPSSSCVSAPVTPWRISPVPPCSAIL